MLFLLYQCLYILTVNAILKILTIFFFRILCWQCWKTAVVHQRIIMLDEWDEDNELAPLKPVVERAGSTSTCFVYSTFGSHLGGEACIMLRKMKTPPVPRWWVYEQIWIWATLPNWEGRKTGFREVSCVFVYLVL